MKKFLVLSILVFSGFLVSCKNNEAEKTATPPTSNSSTNIEIPTSNWQTIQNKEFRFEIKLPKTWSLIEGSDKNSFDINPDIPGPRDSFYAPTKLIIRDNKDNLSIQDWFLKEWPKNKEDVKNFGPIKIDSSDEAITLCKTDSLNICSYYIKKNLKIYEFSLTDIGDDTSKENTMMKTIVETFKFI